MGSIRPGDQDKDRLDRSRRIDWLDVDKIERSKCAVVGAGALGNEVVKDLVLSGIKDILLIDMDHVVRSNLNRCVMFRDIDAETKAMKVDVVAKRATEMNPEVRFKVHKGRVEELDWKIFKDYDLIFGCLDNVAARLHVNSHSYYAGSPYIDGGTDGSSGKVQVVIPPKTPCLQCAMNRSHFKVLERRYSCTGTDIVFHERRVAAEITTTSVIAAIQVREGLKILSGREDSCIRNVMYYNGLLGTMDEYETSIDPNCPNHP
ncbi:MAG: ThiF family adenylyltransferase [Methanomassiliicoccales archaeon]|nr:MAG: ThiF family adenylyltransferase [Methanomassiliicoccales archaeon]